jgi:hypothetical protein
MSNVAISSTVVPTNRVDGCPSRSLRGNPGPDRRIARFLQRARALRGAFPMAAANPFQFWIQLAEQWQKAWADAMAFWVKAGKQHDAVGPRRY